MNRKRALKIVLVLVGLLFTAGVVLLTMFFSREPSVPMLMSHSEFSCCWRCVTQQRTAA
jgi:flagellar basal body-associated protein FliL